MPFPPINLHQRISSSSSPGRELFRKKKTTVPPPPPPPQAELTNKPGEEMESSREKLSTSWTAANLRNLGRRSQQEKSKSPAQRTAGGQETQGQGCRSSKQSSRSSLGKEDGRESREIQFTLSLTPEAIVVIQKRNLEKQMIAKQQKCCGSADFRHRKVFPSKKTHGHGGSKGSCLPPAAKPETTAEQDISTIVKISLLNDQYKYDDVEYEEEDGDVDETVVRKCKEWLKGVESAAAFGKVDRLSALPHLKGC